MLKSIKDLISNKPSNAVQAMIDGLRNQNKRWNFSVDMHTYGASGLFRCFGCAATCTIQELAQANLTKGTIESSIDRSDSLGFVNYELAQFEHAINEARMGCFEDIFHFCGIPRAEAARVLKDPVLYNAPSLETDNWKQRLHYYEVIVEFLQKEGF